MPISEIIKLKELSVSKQRTFMYLTCERLYPNYLYFSENYNFGNPFSLQGMLNYLFENIFNPKVNSNKIIDLIEKTYSLIPEPGNYDTIFASSALDASNAIYESLNFLIDSKFSRIESVSTMATDTIHMYIQDIENLDFNTNKDFQKIIDTHPLMVREINIQIGIINYLYNSDILDLGDVQILSQLQNTKKRTLEM